MHLSLTKTENPAAKKLIIRFSMENGDNLVVHGSIISRDRLEIFQS